MTCFAFRARFTNAKRKTVLRGGTNMLKILGRPRQFCDGITRRDLMAVGGLVALGSTLSLESAFAAEERRPAHAMAGKAKNVIHLYLHGGAPTQDMYDLKPSAPKEIRGEFNPIAT